MKTVTLPYPPSSLSPNSRGHWSLKAKAAAKARADAKLACLAAGIRALGWGGMSVTIEFCAPDRRRRDLDNQLASLKPTLDGLADASGVDDSLWSLILKRGDPVNGGAVVVEIQETKEEARKRANAPGLTTTPTLTKG